MKTMEEQGRVDKENVNGKCLYFRDENNSRQTARNRLILLDFRLK